MDKHIILITMLARDLYHYSSQKSVRMFQGWANWKTDWS